MQSRDGRIEKHSDQRVQAALTVVFAKFAELGSARQVLLWMHQDQVTLPVLEHDPTWGDRVAWRLPHYNSILNLLQNPIYAGAYAFGRTETRTRVIAGVPHKTRGHQRARADWFVLLPHHHEGYIPWDTYERNQQLLADNAQMKGQMAAGAVRRGRSLLAGLLRCASCGRRLQVTYSGGVTRYSCRRNHQAGCALAFGGLRLETAVERELLRVLTPGAIEAALASAEQTADETTASRQALALELREAQYEVTRAQRQYDAVDPEHRLVAGTLEQRWNTALERVAALERQLASFTPAAPAAAPDRATLLGLARDFPVVWADPATDARIKKRLTRLLIHDILVAPATDRTLDVLIHWVGGKHTRLPVPRNRTGEHRRCTAREVVDVVRDLARSLPDAQIARILNRLGYRTGAGNTWTQQRVISLRHAHDIPVFAVEPAGPTTLTIEQAARALGVSTTTVRRLIINGRLPAQQPVPYAPWAIAPEHLGAEAVQRAVEAVKAGRQLPQTAPARQLTLTNGRI